MNKTEEKALQIPDSRQQPAWHLVVLSFFTFSLYIPYWGYKSWRDLKREAVHIHGPLVNPAAEAAGVRQPEPAPLPPRNKKQLDEHSRETLTMFRGISPLLRGLGLLVPFLNIYLLTTLLIGVCNLVPRESSLPRRHPLLATGLVVGGYLVFVALSRLPGQWFILSLLSGAPIAVGQHWLNEYWRSVESDEVMVRGAFSVAEMLFIIIGASAMGLVTAGFMIGVR